MNTSFDEWLLVLKRDGKLVENIPAAIRGFAWSLEVSLQGDYTGASLEGRIASAPDGTSLATMNVTGPAVADGYSTWVVSMLGSGGINTTASLPVDGGLDGVERFPCAFVVTPSGGSAELVAGGVFTLLGLV